MSNWFEDKIKYYSNLKGYQKPTTYRDYLKLDSNENLAIDLEFQNKIISEAKKRSDVREYPLQVADELIKELSNYLKIDSSMIGLGNGSDQILDLILINFATKNTPILVSNPTFSFFEERCKLYSIPTIPIDFDDNMKLNVLEFIKKSKNAKILYLDTPNNPTGFQFSLDDLEKLITQFSGLIIIDEAYGEFGDYSVADMTKKQKNLIVVKTFSKSFGLAGLRLGYFVADQSFTNIFNNILQYPYPNSTLSIRAGVYALKKANIIQSITKEIRKERQRMVQNLRQHDIFTVYDSKANFILFSAGDSSRRIYDALIEQGISIRKFDNEKLAKFLRVTIGTKEMNSRFLLAIRDLLE